MCTAGRGPPQSTLTMVQTVESPKGLRPSGKSDNPPVFPGEIFPGNPLGHYTVFSDFWINIVKIMQTRVALWLTLNIFQFYQEV